MASNEPYDIKIAMLRLNTKNSQIIKQYYIKMEELIRLYAQYTTLFIEKEKEQMSREMNSLQLIMEEMKIANLKQEEERKLDRLMLTESRNMLRIMGIEIKTVKNNNNNLIDQNNELLERVDEVLLKWMWFKLIPIMVKKHHSNILKVVLMKKHMTLLKYQIKLYTGNLLHYLIVEKS